MAAVIGDYISDPARFHAMIANPPLQHHHHPHSHDASSAPYRPSSKPRRASTTPRPTRSASASASAHTPQDSSVDADADAEEEEHPATVQRRPVDASRIPSPPPSSSPAGRPCPSSSDNGKKAPAISEMITSTVAPSHVPTSSTTSTSSHRLQQPSPSSDDFQIPLSAGAPQAPRQTVIHVRDLAHVKVLAKSESLSGGDSGMISDSPINQIKYDISAMPINDIIEMVAALLTKITSTNDLQHDAMQRNATHQQQANTGSDASGSSISPMSHSVLAFHGKNVPAITIHSYLARIHKYCPTTFEVFLSLLVYFDRMTERVNDLVTKSEEARKNAAQSGSEQQEARSDVPMKDTSAAEISDESDSDLADDDDDEEMEDTKNVKDSKDNKNNRKESGKVITGVEDGPSVHGPSTYFVVDSFNIHRLIISGVTCSSKFFSDVFYTNSRYAKVGGLPLAELNHLELQFLVLNDFRLAIPVEDLEAYATMLVEFYAREVATKPQT